MLNRKILFFITFLTITLSSCSSIKNDIKTNKIEKTKTSFEKKISTIAEEKKTAKTKKELNIYPTTFIQNKQEEMNVDNDKKNLKSFKNSRNNFYLNFSFGYSNLKNYDVYNTLTNKAIWDDRYTELGNSIEIGIGYDFGKIRTEISYAQENGRFDEYLTYLDNSITKIENGRGKLHKDFYTINTYYDFRDSKKFSPFIGLGIGYVNSFQDSAPFIPEYARQTFVLQLKGGLSYKFFDKNIFYIEGFIRDAKSHTTNDGLGTPYVYEAKNGFDSSGVQIGFRKLI